MFKALSGQQQNWAFSAYGSVRQPFFFSLDGYDSWIIIGRTAADVEAKHAEVRSEERDRILAEEIQEEEKQKVAREAETNLCASIADLSAEKGDWDVTGVWKITGPEFQEGDHGINREMEVWIYRVDGTKISQMFAKFDFDTPSRAGSGLKIPPHRAPQPSLSGKNESGGLGTPFLSHLTPSHHLNTPPGAIVGGEGGMEAEGI